MHFVSLGWENNQKEQIREKTDVIGYIFVGEASKHTIEKASGVAKYRGVITCGALCSYRQLPVDSVIECHYSGITITFTKELFGDVSPLSDDTINHKSTFIEITYGANNSTFSININDIINDNQYQPYTISNITKIEFSIQGGGSNNVVGNCEWFATIPPLKLTSKNIKSLNYRGHCSVLNEDLPYQKIVLETVDKIIPKNTTCAYFKIGYKGINGGNDEYIPLGCGGYYFLDKSNYGKIQYQYTFADILSTLTYPNIFLTSVELTPYEIGYDILTRGEYTGIFDANISNIDISNLSASQITDEIDFVSVENTSAEILQMLGQKITTTLTTNKYGVISFFEINENAIQNDTNYKWLLKQDISIGNIYSNLVINYYKPQFSYLKTDHSNQKILELNLQSGKNSVLLDKAYGNSGGSFTGAFNFSGDASYTPLGSALGYLLINYSGSTYQQDLSAYGYWEQYKIGTQEYSIADNENGNAFCNLDLKMLNTPPTQAIIDHYTKWLKRYATTSIQVRLDPKYTLLDIIEAPAHTYGKFIVEDIEMTYDGGLNGTLSGTALEIPLEPPTTVEAIINSSSDYSITFYNPNSCLVSLDIETSSQQDIDLGQISAGETKVIKNGDYPSLDTIIFNYLNNLLSNEDYIYFHTNWSAYHEEMSKYQTVKEFLDDATR